VQWRTNTDSCFRGAIRRYRTVEAAELPDEMTRVIAQQAGGRLEKLLLDLQRALFSHGNYDRLQCVALLVCPSPAVDGNAAGDVIGAAPR
jgi:hypothetical protein